MLQELDIIAVLPAKDMARARSIYLDKLVPRVNDSFAVDLAD